MSIKYVVPFIALSLAACGGSSDLTALDRSFVNNGTTSNLPIKEYDDGTSIIAIKGKLNSGELVYNSDAYIFAFTDDAQAVIDLYSGVINLNISDYDDFEGSDYYVYEAAGFSSNGKEVNANVIGYTLADGGHVSFAVAQIDEKYVSFTDGSISYELPIGEHTYSYGDTLIAFKDTMEESYDDLTLVANFSTEKGSLLGLTDTLYMSATNFEIDIDNGTFTGETAEIGRQGGSDKIAASITGAFSGLAAEGVHGLLYPNKASTDFEDCGDCGLATFYAVKDSVFE